MTFKQGKWGNHSIDFIDVANAYTYYSNVLNNHHPANGSSYFYNLYGLMLTLNLSFIDWIFWKSCNLSDTSSSLSTISLNVSWLYFLGESGAGRAEARIWSTWLDRRNLIVFFGHISVFILSLLLYSRGRKPHLPLKEKLIGTFNNFIDSFGDVKEGFELRPESFFSSSSRKVFIFLTEFLSWMY